MKLLLSQKNTLFQILESDEEFSPNNFLLNEIHKPRYITQIILKDSDYKFTMDRGSYENLLSVIYSPGENKIVDRHDGIKWETCISHFYDWLSFLQREITAPNLWEKFQSTVESISLSNDSNNSKFTHQEYLELSDKINILINAIPSLNLLDNQTAAIQTQLNLLLEKTNDLGKFDWKNLFIGTIISVIIQLNVNPENANALWKLIKGIFSNYFLE